MALLSGPIKAVELELISRRVVPIHLNQLRHTPAAVPALEMQHKVNRIRDAAPDSMKGQLNIRLQHAARKPADDLRGRVCVDRGQASGMAGVERLGKIEGFGATDLADQDPVGPGGAIPIRD
jgi:hypothetical protein